MYIVLCHTPRIIKINFIVKKKKKTLSFVCVGNKIQDKHKKNTSFLFDQTLGLSYSSVLSFFLSIFFFLN
jgi:hypothetical protein